MSDPLYWRLYYADGSYQDEAEDGSSILMSRPGAVILVAMKGPEPRLPVCKVELFDTEKFWKPIWYRKRSVKVRTSGLAASQEAVQLDATVFGKALAGERKDDRAKVDVNLYASFDGVTVVNCPQDAIDQGAIDNLLFGKY